MKEYNREKTAEIREMFKNSGVEEKDLDTSWTDNLKMEGKGNNLHIAQSVDNLKLILTNDPLLKDRFGLDLFSHRYLLKGTSPGARWTARPSGQTPTTRAFVTTSASTTR